MTTPCAAPKQHTPPRAARSPPRAEELEAGDRPRALACGARGDELTCWRRPGLFPLQVEVALDFARGMAYLHSRRQPIVHRDLK